MIQKIFSAPVSCSVCPVQLADHIFQNIILHNGRLRAAILISYLAGFTAKINYYPLAFFGTNDGKLEFA